MGYKEQNAQLIDERLEAGLAILREYYEVTECEVDPILANPVIGGRPHQARRYDIQGVGNLLAMTVKDADQAQLSSFVITPYAKDLPLFSTDYVYSGDKRFFLIEIYDLAAERGEEYERGIQSFAGLAEAWGDMPDMPTQPCWYDDIRPVFCKQPVNGLFICDVFFTERPGCGFCIFRSLFDPRKTVFL